MDRILLTLVPVWVWVVVLVGVAGLLGTFVAALPRAARPLAAVALLAWVALTGALAVCGAFVQDVPWIGPTIVVAVALTWLGLRRLGSGVDLVALTAGQTFRVVGGVFVVLWLVGTLPPVFALPAGLGDIAIGLAAPVIARGSVVATSAGSARSTCSASSTSSSRWAPGSCRRRDRSACSRAARRRPWRSRRSRSC
jgi:hypothetical protein